MTTRTKSQTKFQNIWKFIEPEFKKIFQKKIKDKNWEPFWKSTLESQIVSIFGFDFIQRKYAKDKKVKILYTLPVTIGFYRIISFDTYKLRTPSNFTDALISSLLDPNVDIIVCPFDTYGIYQENVFHLDVRHATCLIFNKINKLVEFYDPMENSREHNIDNERIHKVLTEYINSITILEDYKLISLQTLGLDGFQYIEELSSIYEEYSIGGLCFIWSLFYAELRILYPEETPDVLLKHYLTKTDMDTLKNFIHDYAIYIFDNMSKDKSFFEQFPFTIETMTKYIKNYFENGLVELHEHELNKLHNDDQKQEHQTSSINSIFIKKHPKKTRKSKNKYDAPLYWDK